jgi:hypothetical protein
MQLLRVCMIDVVVHHLIVMVNMATVWCVEAKGGIGWWLLEVVLSH